jgi:membrane protein YqaA with SNARE-associated domain
VSEPPLPAATQPSTWRLRLVQVITIVAIIAAVAAAFYFRDRMQALKPYGYVAIFIVSLVSNATLILPVPGLAFTGFMGAIFNPALVGIVAGVGQAIGELTGYMAGYSGQTLIDNNPRYQKLAAWMRRYGALTILVLAAIPNPVFDVAGIIAGALRMPVWQFLLAAAAGKIIKNIASAYLGDLGLGWLWR